VSGNHSCAVAVTTADGRSNHCNGYANAVPDTK